MTDTKPTTDPAETAASAIAGRNNEEMCCCEDCNAEQIRQAYAPILAAAEEMVKQLEFAEMKLSEEYFQAAASECRKAYTAYRELVPKE